MTVYLGNAGNVELTRDSEDIITGTIRAVDVSATKDMFSFDFSFMWVIWIYSKYFFTQY